VLIADCPASFRLLTDLGRLESMDLACATELGRIMDLCAEKGAGKVVCVVPDPRRDIGLSIIALFHYRHRVRVATCKSVGEAADLLSL